MAAFPQWNLLSIGLTKSVQPYWRLAIATIPTMPSTSCTHRALADARLSAAGLAAVPMSRLLSSVRRFSRAGSGAPTVRRLTRAGTGHPFDDGIVHERTGVRQREDDRVALFNQQVDLRHLLRECRQDECVVGLHLQEDVALLPLLPDDLTLDRAPRRAECRHKIRLDRGRQEECAADAEGEADEKGRSQNDPRFHFDARAAARSITRGGLVVGIPRRARRQPSGPGSPRRTPARHRRNPPA